MIVGTSPSAPSLYISTEGRISVGTPLAAFKFNITDGALCVDTYLNCETIKQTPVIGNGAGGADPVGRIFAGSTTITESDYAEYFPLKKICRQARW